jgi:hypothetical protein
LCKIIAAGIEIAQAALPIRCLEATFVGIALTQGVREVHRLPIAFKSRCGGKDYRHIVLCVVVDGCYGAIGLSRRETLMDKPLIFPSLVALINEYILCYSKLGHDVVSFKPGLLVSHNALSKLVPCWRFVSVTIPAGCRDVAEHSPSRDVLLQLERMLVKLSEEYSNLPPDAWEAQGCMTYGKVPLQTSSPSVDENGEEPTEGELVSDCEENQRRVQLLLRGRSPFESSSSLASSGIYSSSLAPADLLAATSFSTKLRRVVSDCSLPSSTPVTPTAPVPRVTRARSNGGSDGRSVVAPSTRRVSVGPRPSRGLV